MRVATAVATLALCFAAAACHRSEVITDLHGMNEVRGSLILTPEGRAVHARRLGGVPLVIIGVVASVGTDSLSIRADEVRFSDIGRVPFGQGELRFARNHVETVTRELLDRRKSVIVSALGVLGVAIVGTVFSPGDGFFGVGRTARPTAR